MQNPAAIPPDAVSSRPVQNCPLPQGGRDGRRLRVRPPLDREAPRAQGHAAADAHGPRDAGPLRARGAGDGGDRERPHRRDLRRRGGRRHGGALPGDGAAARRGPRQHPGALWAPFTLAGDGGPPLPGRPRARQDPRGGHRPPRLQAAEPVPDHARRRLAEGEDPRLRDREGGRRRLEDGAADVCHRDARLHVAGADHGRRNHRAGGRSVCARPHRVRAADRCLVLDGGARVAAHLHVPGPDARGPGRAAERTGAPAGRDPTACVRRVVPACDGAGPGAAVRSGLDAGRRAGDGAGHGGAAAGAGKGRSPRWCRATRRRASGPRRPSRGSRSRRRRPSARSRPSWGARCCCSPPGSGRRPA